MIGSVVPNNSIEAADLRRPATGGRILGIDETKTVPYVPLSGFWPMYQAWKWLRH